MYKTAFFLLILATCYVLLATPVSAAGISLGIDPPILQVVAVPPATIKAPITIENNGDSPIDLAIGLQPFKPSSAEDGTIVYTTGKDVPLGVNPGFFEYVQIVDANDEPIDTITLSPGQQIALGLHINVPKEEPLSDYYFSIIFVSKNTNQENPNGSQVVGAIATNVLVSLGPKGQTQGWIEEFSTPRFLQSGPVPFTVRIRNTSDHLITPEGSIVITNMFGQKIGNMSLLPVNVLAGSIRRMPDAGQIPNASSAAAFPLAPSPFTRPIAIWPESFLLGPYQATLTVALSPQGPIYTRSIYFIGAPIQAFVVLMVAAIIGFFLYKRVQKHRKKTSERK